MTVKTTFTLEAAKVRVGVTDDASDVLIAATMAASLEALEAYLNRKIRPFNDSVKETQTPFNGHSIQLHTLPVEDVNSITLVEGGSAVTDFHFDADVGRVFFPRTMAHKLLIDYKGGYSVAIPPLFEAALWMLFDSIWPTVQKSTSAGGAVVSQTGAVKSISIPDVGTVQFDVGAASAGTAAAGSSLDTLFGALASALLAYRIVEA
jgi:hypothetical protein